MIDEFDMARERIAAWWNGELIDRACIAFAMSERKGVYTNPNSFWPSTDMEPDLEALVHWYVEAAKSKRYFGEALPTIPHLYGNRGTPMIMSAYLGGIVKLEKGTVWIDPIIEDWQNFIIRFNPNNIWWERSCKFFEIAVKAAKEVAFPCLPDYGDSLTVFSLLRGAERLLFDIIDNKEVIVAAQDKFLNIWPKYHETNLNIYQKSFPGDYSWAMWAPGRTYACQCDFSTMLSPDLFKDLVVPEIERFGTYLKYILWHLDGPDEIKHLDILLNLSQIKAIQWIPGVGSPSASHWLPMLKKIQAHKKSLQVFAKNEEEVRTLLTELSPEGLYISGGFTGNTIEEANNLLRMVEKLSVKRK